MLCTYVCMLHVYPVGEDCRYQLLRRYKYSQCCQITCRFKCTKTFRSYSDNRSYVRKYWLPTDQIWEQFLFLYKGRFFKMYFKNAITIQISYFFKQNGHNTHITNHIMTLSTSCIRHET